MDTQIHNKRVLLHMVAEDKHLLNKESQKNNSTSSAGTKSYIESPPSHSARQATTIVVKAQFLVDGQTDGRLSFLDGTSGQVHVPYFDECAARQHEKEINYIVLGTQEKHRLFLMLYALLRSQFTL